MPEKVHYPESTMMTPENPYLPETPQDRIARALAAAWQRRRPEVQERVRILRQAAADLQTSTLTRDHAEKAAATAHNLAGALGMYGFPAGTDDARELEVLFGSPAPDPSRCRQLVEQIETLLFSEPNF